MGDKKPTDLEKLYGLPWVKCTDEDNTGSDPELVAQLQACIDAINELPVVSEFKDLHKVKLRAHNLLDRIESNA